jgi:DNA-binding transcriptional ArsR family regulator
MADLECAKQSSAPSWLPCVAGRGPLDDARGAFRARGCATRHLTPTVIYVINRLHSMSRIEAKTDVFRAIADPTRRALLDRLRAGPANAGTLAADFRSSRPAISKHLRVLRESRLVVDTRIGRERVYAVNPLPLQSVAGWLEGYRAFWQVSLTRLKRNLEEK